MSPVLVVPPDNSCHNVDTVKSGWSILYIEALQVLLFKKSIVFISLKICFVLANSADPDERPHYAAFRLVFTVCQSISVGDSGLGQRVKVGTYVICNYCTISKFQEY